MSELKPYPKYKDSGVEWIGEMPEEWDFVKLRYLVTIRNNSRHQENLPYLGLENIESKTGKIISVNESEIESQSIRFKKNDVLFGKLRPYLAKVTHVNFEGYCSTEFIVLKSNKINDKLLKFLMLSSKFISHVNSSTYGTKMPRANWEFIKNIFIPLSSQIQQEKIVGFLNNITSEIESLIKDKERLIELLEEKRQAIITETVTKGLDPNVKMKNSGIEWIGEIPEHWELNKLKRGIQYLTDFEANGSFRSVKENVKVDEGKPFAWYVRATDLEKKSYGLNKNNRYVDKKSYEFLKKTKLYGGELLITKRGEIGKLYLMPEVKVPSTLGPNTYLIRLNNDYLHPKFVYYWFISESGKRELVNANKSTTIGALYKDDIKECYCVYPNGDEQERIIKFLEHKIDEIDLIVNKIKEQIQKLQDYRESLIYEAVTGKIDLRNYEVELTND